MTMRIALDRDLPIPIGAQLKGQIEYGIVSGALTPGELLPSVRELAAAEGIAQVTVSHVYSALKREGLITVQPGKGTYVARDEMGSQASAGLGSLHLLVDGMVSRALDDGFTSAQISRMVTARLARGSACGPRIALVGIFVSATEAYRREVTALLAGLEPEVIPFTLEQLHSSEEERARACGTELILTIANRVWEVRQLLAQSHPPVHGLTFVAHPETVARLQALPVGAALGVVSTFAEFLPTMLQGIARYATLAQPPLCAVLSDTERVDAVVRQADAVIYATGSEAIASRVSSAVPVIEYLHTPEPSSVRAALPLLGELALARRMEGGDGRHKKRARGAG